MPKFVERRRDEIFPDEVSVAFIQKARKLSNSARYNEVYKMAVDHLSRFPDSILFAYYEAVFSAEDNSGYTPAQLRARHQKAAKKLRAILLRLNGVDENFRASVRNEYYWFSHQPYKQYLLGKEMVRKGRLGSLYSQGVGAAELAKAYSKKGKRALANRWGKTSEQAWLQFFKKVDANWYNSYLFYASALAYQGKFEAMDEALLKAAQIAGKGKNWATTKQYRKEILSSILKRN